MPQKLIGIVRGENIIQLELENGFDSTLDQCEDDLRLIPSMPASRWKDFSPEPTNPLLFPATSRAKEIIGFLTDAIRSKGSPNGNVER